MNVHDRFTSRVTPARLALEARRARRPLVTLVLALVVGVACWAWILAQVGGQLFQPTQTVRFAVDDATGVVADRDDVRVLGIPAGKITGIELTDTGAVLTASIDDNHGTVHRDARARLRPATALQDMYLDVVDRGTARAGSAAGGPPLPAAQTDTSVNVTDVLQAFDPLVRRRLSAMLEELGGGLDDRGVRLRSAFAEVVPLADVAMRVTRQLAVRGERTRRLVRDVGTLSGELARRERELRRFVGASASTLTALRDSAPELDGTLRELPGTLQAATAGFRALQTVLGDVDRAVDDLGPVAAELPGGLDAVRAISAEADPAVRALDRPVRDLAPLVDRLRPLSGTLDGTLTELRPQIPAVDHLTRALLPCVESKAIQKFFQWTPSVFKFQDANGPIGRGDATIGLDSYAGTKDPVSRPHPGCSTPPKGGRP